MRAHFTHSVLLGVLLLVTACPGDKGVGDDTSGAATDPATGPATATDSGTTAGPGTTGEPEPTGGQAASCPEHAKVDACCCFEARPVDEPRYVEVVCPATALCDTVEFECDDLDVICTTTTAPALECALTTLAAGTGVGLVEVHYNIGSGYGDTRLKVYMQGDGTAYIVNRQVLDLSDVHRATGLFVLQPKAYFDECKATMTDDEQAKCLMAPYDGGLTEQCVEELYAEAL